MKKIYLVNILVILICSLCGCGSSVQGTLDEEVYEEPVPVAEFRNAPVNFADTGGIMESRLVGNRLYYVKTRYDGDNMIPVKSVCVMDMTGDGNEEELFSFSGDGRILQAMTPDRDGNLYMLYYEEENPKLKYYAVKYNPAGGKEYDTPLEDEAVERCGYRITLAAADGNGSVCYGTQDGTFFCLDASGAYTGAAAVEPSASFTRGGIVSDGADGIWFYGVTERELLLYRVAADTAAVGAARAVSGEDAGSAVVMDGWDAGILISEQDALWNYKPETDEKTRVVNWNDEFINITGTMVEHVQPIEKGMLVLTFDVFQNRSETAVITLRENMKKKRTVTFGVEESIKERWAQWVGRFNRSSLEYRVEFRVYEGNTFAESNQALYQDLIRGEAPDLLDISYFPGEVLAKNKALENLEDYFKDSGVVDKADFLPGVWEAGVFGGKKLGAAPDFTLDTWILAGQSGEAAGWTVDGMLSGAGDHPDAFITPYGGPMDLMRSLYPSAVSSFVNWKKETNRFGTEEFIRLLEGVKALRYTNSYDMDGGEAFERFVRGEVLMMNLTLYHPESFAQAAAQLEGRGRIAGYPTMNGDAWHGIRTDILCGINSASRNKPGAWAFIEYILSPEAQGERYGAGMSFPARTESIESSFREFYEKAEKNREYCPDPDEFLELVRNGHYIPNGSVVMDVENILQEEYKAYFAGDRSAEDTAAIIANRVQLFLKEQ